MSKSTEVVKYLGLVKTENGYACEKCKGAQFKQSMHIDYSDHAQTHYVCQSCGNVVCVAVPRGQEWGE